jgi:hypothetical protein
VKRVVEGIGKWVDVREYLRGLTVGSPAAVAAIAEAGFVGEFVVLAVDVEIRGSGAVKVSEVVQALTGSEDMPHRAVRFAMGTWVDGEVRSPFTPEREPAVEGETSCSSSASL